MKKTEQLANQFREVILDGTWIANTNYKSQLEHLDLKVANAQFQSLNSISILSQHIHYYIHGVINVFINNKLEIRDKYSFDFPELTSQYEWQSFLNKFWKDTETLADLIEKLPEEKLTQSFVDEKYGTYERNIDGLIEHAYYHLGQITLIKKLISGNS